jgi:hypothetical protein
MDRGGYIAATMLAIQETAMLKMPTPEAATEQGRMK